MSEDAHSSEITEREVQMTADDWRAAGAECVEHAVGWLRREENFGRAGALVEAARLLRAADAFHGRANIMEIGEPSEPDRTTLEIYPAA